MDYVQATRWLHGLLPLGVVLGTEPVAEVLHRLGDPQRSFAAIHIAGTNGKGSTAAFSAHLLLAASRAAARDGDPPPRLGLYTSPHLLRLTERIRLSDPHFTALAECAEADLAGALSAVQKAAEQDPSQPLSFFESITVAAFLLFARAGVELAVVEVGLGGRLDATRLCEPVVTAVTSIAMDHTELLGPTLADIAREKAGIFRQGVPACFPCVDSDALWVLLGEAARVGAPVKSPRPLPHALFGALSLTGTHQRENAALALLAVEQVPLPLRRYLADPEVQRQGLAETRWPARLEHVVTRDDGAEIWLDAAHNPQGSHALAVWLHHQIRGRRLTVLFGTVAGKPAEDMLDPLCRATHTVLTRPPSPRGRDPQELAPLVRARLALWWQRSPIVLPDVSQALRQAQELTPPDGMLLVYGSIFLVAEVRRLLLGEPADPTPLQDPSPDVQPN